MRADNPSGLGFLELDGNVVPGNCNGTQNCTGGTSTCASPITSSAATDWSCLFKQVSVFTGSASPTAAQLAAAYVSLGLPANAVVSAFVPNGYAGGPLCPAGSGSSCVKPHTYTSGSKDILDISANSCASANNLLAKDYLVNTYGIKYIDPANNHQIVYIGDEKLSNGGDNNIGVWFDQGTISVPTPCPSGSGIPFTGAHVVGDILTVSNFTKGGVLAGINAYVWVGNSAVSCPPGTSGSPPLCLKFSGNVCNPTAASTQFVCGIVSHVITPGVVDGSPSGNVCGFNWVTYSKELGGMNNSLTAKHCTAVNSFYEMGIDLTALGFTSCASTAVPETRSSQQLTATLFDFTILNLNSCATATSTTSSSTGTVTSGASVTDTATVTSTEGAGTPTGSVQFYLCYSATAAASCDVTVAGNKFGGTVPLSGGGTATSPAVTGSSTPLNDNLAGFYCWSAVFIPTSGFQASQSTTTTNECFQVVAPTTTTTSSSATGTVSPGSGSVTDKVTVAAVPSAAGTPTGSVQFYFCGPTASPTPCGITLGNALGLPVTLSSGSATSTPAQSPTAVGYYCFSAVYTPNTSDFTGSQSTTTTNECFQVVAPTTTTTTSSSTGVVSPGTGSVTDEVTVAAIPPAAGTPTGSVQFYFCGPTSSATTCATSAGNALGSPVTLTGGTATSTPAESPTQVGFYCFSAVYTPDTSNFLGSQSTTTVNECFQVVAPTTTTTASSSTGVVSPGSGSVTDLVTVAAVPPAAGTPTGSVQFYFCGPTPSATSCAISPADALGSPITLTGGSATSTPAESPTPVGFYCFSAVYTPDTSDFTGSQSTTTTNECFHVVAPTTTTTTSSSTGTVSPGSGSVTDNVVVAAVPPGAGTPTGSVQFYICGPTTAATPCATVPGNALGSAVTLSGGSATSTPAESPTPVGFYCFSAVYTPDTTDFTGSQSTTTTNECFQVVAPTTTTTTSSDTALNVVPGTSVTDGVTVAAVPAAAGTPTGSVQFYACGPTPTATPCATTAGNAFGSAVTLSAGSATSDALSGSSTPVNDNVPGFYCFSAVYTPDTSNFLGSQSTTTSNECFQVVNSIPKITSFGYTNTPANNAAGQPDPQTGQGTVVYSFTITNYGTTSATLTSATLSVAGTASVTCTSSTGGGTLSGNTLDFSGTVLAANGGSASFTLTCSYSGNSGDTVVATLTASFTNVSGSGSVSGSPATIGFTIQKT